MIRWQIAQKNKTQRQGQNGVPASVIDILKNRGIDEASVEDFLSSAPKETYDPFLMTDLKETAETLIAAADRGDTICVFGDYDADGITSSALLCSVLRKLSPDVFSYVPSRFTDGYGLNDSAIDKIAGRGTKLLVTVDCGSTSPDEVEYAKSLGMTVIVTDHHMLREGMEPDCLFVNPKRGGYPFRDLCGCGVAFKLAQGIQRTLAQKGDDRFTKNDLNSLLDLVAIATVADIVPLLGENRSLVKYGLDRINRRDRQGLVSLLSALDLSEKNIDSSNISYIIAPNLNALGRMSDASPGVELLESTASKERLDDLARQTIRANIERKAAQEKTMNICRKQLALGTCGKFAPVILAEGAHEGVAGIVAGNLKEELYRPVCIVTPAENGTLKGTGRSVPGINLHECLARCGDIFERFGGHAGACGFSLKPGTYEVFRDRMQEIVRDMSEKDPELFTEVLEIEKELDADEKTLDFARQLCLLKPFGEANPAPVFCIMDAKVGYVRLMGSEEQHIRFSVVGRDGVEINCVLFGRADEYKDIIFGSKRIDVAGELEINEYRGGRRPQIRVRDIRAAASDK